MNRGTNRRMRIIRLDMEISRLRKVLEEMTQTTKNDGRMDFSRLQRKYELERKIDQMQAMLSYVLQGHQRPFYFHRLPMEMLEKIFSYIEDPQDQLTLVRTFPVVSKLMRWNEGTLQFQLTYPLIYPLICKDPILQLKLCQVSPTFQTIVLNHYERVLLPDLKIKYCKFFMEEDILELNRYINELDNIDYKKSPWMSENRFPFAVHFKASINSFGGQGSRRLQTFLEKHGAKLLASKLTFCRTVDEVQEEGDERGGNIVNVGADLILIARDVLGILNGFLTKTPNLRHFDVTSAVPLLQPTNPNRIVQLPHLPHLKVLETSQSLTSLLLPVYGESVEKMTLLGGLSKTLRLKNMTKLESCCLAVHGCLQSTIRNIFSNSPLRQIWLQINGVNPRPRNILHLLIVLGPFRGTLDHLLVMYSPALAVEDRVMIENRDLMLNVNLPKLKLFFIAQYFGSLDFLLSLTSLDKLGIIRCKEGTEEGANFLKVPRDEARKHEGNVWKFLANLMALSVGNVVDGRKKEFTMTRLDHLKYRLRHPQPLAIGDK